MCEIDIYAAMHLLFFKQHIHSFPGIASQQPLHGNCTQSTIYIYIQYYADIVTRQIILNILFGETIRSTLNILFSMIRAWPTRATAWPSLGWPTS